MDSGSLHRHGPKGPPPPYALRDAFGSTSLTAAERKENGHLHKKATDYSKNFIEEEDSLHFRIGLSNFRTNPALVYLIEAARQLCAASDDVSLRLLRMAIIEIEATKRERNPFQTKEPRRKQGESDEFFALMEEIRSKDG